MKKKHVMYTYKCDRCGVVEEDNQYMENELYPHSKLDLKWGYVRSGTLIDGDGTFTYLEICPKCLSDFQTWLVDGKNKQ